MFAYTQDSQKHVVILAIRLLQHVPTSLVEAVLQHCFERHLAYTCFSMQTEKILEQQLPKWGVRSSLNGSARN